MLLLVHLQAVSGSEREQRANRVQKSNACAASTLILSDPFLRKSRSTLGVLKIGFLGVHNGLSRCLLHEAWILKRDALGILYSVDSFRPQLPAAWRIEPDSIPPATPWSELGVCSVRFAGVRRVDSKISDFIKGIYKERQAFRYSIALHLLSQSRFFSNHNVLSCHPSRFHIFYLRSFKRKLIRAAFRELNRTRGCLRKRLK